MEFKQNIKQLKQQYFEVAKQFYNSKHIILKMILRRSIYDNLYEADLSFKTCMLNCFNDKNINRLMSRNPEKAIGVLRNRGACCMYTAQVTDRLLKDIVIAHDENSAIVSDLNSIKNSLYNLTEQSIAKSDELAKQNNLALYEDGNFDINKYKTNNKGESL